MLVTRYTNINTTPVPPNNVPSKYQLLITYSFWDITWTRFYRSGSLQHCQRSNQGHTMMLHINTPQPMSTVSPPRLNFLHLTVSQIQHSQDFTIMLCRMKWVKTIPAFKGKTNNSPSSPPNAAWYSAVHPLLSALFGSQPMSSKTLTSVSCSAFSPNIWDACRTARLIAACG